MAHPFPEAFGHIRPLGPEKEEVPPFYPVVQHQRPQLSTVHHCNSDSENLVLGREAGATPAGKHTAGCLRATWPGSTGGSSMFKTFCHSGCPGQTYNYLTMMWQCYLQYSGSSSLRDVLEFDGIVPLSLAASFCWGDFSFLYSLTDWKHMKQQRSEIDERALSSLWSLSASKAMEAIFLDVPHVWKLKGG